MTGWLPDHPDWSLYREARRVAQGCRYRVTALAGRQPITDIELYVYVSEVLRVRPEARCTQEADVAIWLRRYRVTAERFHAAWQRVDVRAAAR